MRDDIIKVRRIIKVRSDAPGAPNLPVGCMSTYLFEGDLPGGWMEPEGQVYRKADLPELWAAIGQVFIIRVAEPWYKRLVRRWLKMAGPEGGLRADEGRLPDLRNKTRRVKFNT